jgi:DNA replication and repair protein RecF
LKINHIKLINFRNYSSQEIAFGSKFNVLAGLNGMGKTNVLDAIYYVCIGKSYFSPTDKVIVKHDEDFFRIEALFESQDILDKIVVKAPIAARKSIEVSGQIVPKLSEHVGKFLCVIVAPSDIHAMLDTSEERRNYINHTISQADRQYLADLITYNQLLKRRNAVLKSFLEQRTFDAIYLESISRGMYEPAKRIYEARRDVLAQMNTIFGQVYHKLSGGAEKCLMVYNSDLQDNDLEALFVKSLEKDKILGRTTCGIHKDDIGFEMNGEPIKNYGSQGQIKSYVLALKLTQYHILSSLTGQSPILLLDDLFDKLDDNRVHHLVTILNEQPFGQVVISDTSQLRIHNAISNVSDNFRIFVVNDGTVKQLDE